MKIVHIILKVLLSLMILTPILGAFWIFPAPTRDLYNTDQAFAFIEFVMWTYIIWGIVITFALGLICLWTRREALAALLLLPVTTIIIGFHAFLDGGLFTGGAIMGVLVFAINLYLLWKNRKQYKNLLVGV